MSRKKYIVFRTNLNATIPGIPTVPHFRPAEVRGATVLRDSSEIEFSFNTEDLSDKDIADLRNDPKVAHIVPRLPMQLHKPVKLKEIDLATAGSESWGIEAIQATNSPYDGEGITVAVLDTGIDRDHEVFDGMNIEEVDFTGEGNGDRHGHGTHCAGSIFGQTLNGFRIGVAPSIERALIGKVLDSSGAGFTEHILAGMDWAAGSGANVVSMSIGLDFAGYVKELVEDDDLPIDIATSRALEGFMESIDLFRTTAEVIRVKGESTGSACLLVAAAGNESRMDVDINFKVAAAPPSVVNGILSVGALGRTSEGLDTAYFSNSKVDISAPGVEVVSARLGGGYISMDGTSMATPHVAGVAVLYAERQKRLEDTIKLLPLTADIIGSGSFDSLVSDYEPLDVGRGLIQAPL